MRTQFVPVCQARRPSRSPGANGDGSAGLDCRAAAGLAMTGFEGGAAALGGLARRDKAVLRPIKPGGAKPLIGHCQGAVLYGRDLRARRHELRHTVATEGRGRSQPLGPGLVGTPAACPDRIHKMPLNEDSREEISLQQPCDAEI